MAFDPEEPDDPASCTVDDQDLIGEADEGAEVTLTVECEVPDVTTLDGQSAVDELETAGFTWAVDDCGDALDECTVGDQDLLEAPPGAEVSLTMEGEAPPDGPDPDCHESYPDDCLDPAADDYDCEGGQGDGPEYVVGPVTVDHAVTDPDPFELDRDANGVGCES